MKNRIKAHRTVRVGDLVPHELNPRVHSQEQREALQALLGELGFARSLLAYELPDGRLKLIDGHLRQGTLDPDEQVTVEVLDVSDDEARKLLLSIDPLAQLASYDDELLDQLRTTVQTDSQTLSALWSSLHQADSETVENLQRQTRQKRHPEQIVPQQWSVVVKCTSEQDQLATWKKLKALGLDCRMLQS
jgi:hypothetical protein